LGGVKSILIKLHQWASSIRQPIIMMKEMLDMKKDSVKKGILLNWDIPEELDK